MPRQSTTTPIDAFTPHASLAALGAALQARDLFDPIRQHVRIAQKTVKDAPSDKLLDAFVAVLAGAHGIAEIETRLRCDPVLQRAFGRQRCAEQSVVQETLNAASADNVAQMQFAVETILHTHSRAYRHRFTRELLVVDIDLTALVCGHTAEGARKGYFGDVPERKRSRLRGRQLARATAAQYHEILVDLLYPGNTVLETVLEAVVVALERALVLTEDKRARTLLRIDADGGAIETINWLLARGYHVLTKDCSTQRAEALSQTVELWYADPRHDRREVGQVQADTADFVRPVRRVAGRMTKSGSSAYHPMVLITTLLPQQARAIAAGVPAEATGRRGELLAYVYAYDQRGGAIEIEIKQDKSGLGIRKRQKKRFAAQQIVVALNALAHNVLVWARRWLAATAPELGRVGLLRWVRDLLAISGHVEFARSGRLRRVRLNARAPRSRVLGAAFQELFKREHLGVRVSAE